MKFLILTLTLLTFLSTSAQNNTTQTFKQIKTSPLLPKFKEKKWSLEKNKSETYDYILKKIKEDLFELKVRGQAKVVSSFIINSEGNIENINIQTTIDILEKEIIKNIESLPQFIPGMKNGKPVDVLFNFSFTFAIY